jgi:dienelactone hydrolase
MKVTVTFTAQDRLLEAGLFIPEHTIDEDPLAAVLIEGAMTGGASEISDRVARTICEQGLVCMVLDHAFYNDDQMAPRSWESPSKRVADIVAALHFLRDNNIVNPQKLIAMGISVGAEYMTKALEVTNLCKGFVIIQDRHESTPDFASRVEVPTTRIASNSYEGAAEEAVLWITSLFNNQQTFVAKDFMGWDSFSE